MKHLNLFVIIFSLLFSSNLFAIDPVLTPPVEPIPPRVQSSLSVSPVSVEIIEDSIAVHFNKAIGTTAITITNEAGEIVYQGIADTDKSLYFVIPIDTLDSGTYSITFESESRTFEQYFVL